ncbi:hypothetical protein JG688_00015629 [Phytophthora aleatoria]|uniref:Uncharacterized protein n=1 Tax=Phytophthora aleatoria TaxID=2496075 RepID=A0A8J5IZ81_9STRA|nr:hypothetical protein JG688_00015629 [Phytophthora aleatoria]
MPMRPHIWTFLTGSLSAVVFVKLDLWIKKTEFVFQWWHTILVRAVEALAISMLLSVCFRGLLFTWVHENPAPAPKGFPYTSAFLAIIFVIEMIKPSCVSTMLEWMSAQADYFDRFFSRLILTMALSTTTYYLIEYPSLLFAQRMSKLLANAEKKASGDWTRFACMERITT